AIFSQHGHKSTFSCLSPKPLRIAALSISKIFSMGVKLSPAKQRKIQGLLEVRQEYKVIANDVRCSSRQVHRIKKNLIDYGTYSKPKQPEQGRKSKITIEIEEVYIFQYV